MKTKGIEIVRGSCYYGTCPDVDNECKHAPCRAVAMIAFPTAEAKALLAVAKEVSVIAVVNDDPFAEEINFSKLLSSFAKLEKARAK